MLVEDEVNVLTGLVEFFAWKQGADRGEADQRGSKYVY